MRAIILSVGDELILGQTVDTNSAWMSQQLAAVGVPVAAHLTVPDDQRAIEQAMLESVGRCDFLLISGGIGPTEDDLTRQALAAVLGQPLEVDGTWLRELEGFFEKRGRAMPAMNRVQAMIPRGATMLFNHAGSAAGIDATYRSGDQKTICRVFVMPGVPKEMKAMFARDVLPHVAEASCGAVILSRTLHTYGLGESAVGERLDELMRRDRNPSVGTTVSEGQVSVRVNARFPSCDEAQRELASTVAACRAALGDLVYGEDGDDLPNVVGDLLRGLRRGESGNDDDDARPTVATAESCTGGLLAKMLTDVAGSGDYFGRGWVTYDAEAKAEVLGVGFKMIREQGLVSEAVAVAMATGARQRADATYGIGVTGVAGPTGGTAETPVGTTCIAVVHDDGFLARTFNFPGDREMIRDRAAKMALTMLRFQLLGRKLPF
jgi:nicotinamide-nucleotide amidase